MNRNELRRQMRARRRALSPSEQHHHSLSLDRNLATSPVFRRSQHIALYLPNDGELDLRPVIARAQKMGKRCYLPVLSPLYHNRLWFAPYRLGDELQLNRFGIPEPVVNWRRMRPVWTLDLVLTPLVAFDLQGNRLGMGGGFYDRTLAYLARRQHWRKPRLIGTAYEFQRIDTLEVQEWDVPLSGVVTESRHYNFDNGR